MPTFNNGVLELNTPPREEAQRQRAKSMLAKCLDAPADRPLHSRRTTSKKYGRAHRETKTERNIFVPHRQTSFCLSFTLVPSLRAYAFRQQIAYQVE